MYKSKIKLARGPSSKVGQVQIVGILEGAASQSPWGRGSTRCSIYKGVRIVPEECVPQVRYGLR